MERLTFNMLILVLRVSARGTLLVLARWVINEESEGDRIYALTFYRGDTWTYLGLARTCFAPIFNISLDTQQDRRFSGLKGDWSRKRVSEAAGDVTPRR